MLAQDIAALATLISVITALVKLFLIDSKVTAVAAVGVDTKARVEDVHTLTNSTALAQQKKIDALQQRVDDLLTSTAQPTPNAGTPPPEPVAPR